MPSVIDAKLLRQMLGHYPTGVCVVTSIDEEDRPIGMTVGSFTSVSLDPPLVAFFPARRSETWPRIERNGRFCVNVMAESQEEVCRRFATPGTDKFAGVGYRRSAAGMPILDDVVAWIECEFYAVHEAGDHLIAVGQVVSLDAHGTRRPLLFFRSRYDRLHAGP